jgi:hypothetical protein
MRTYLRGKVTLLFIVCAVLLAIPAIALADNIRNDVVAGGTDTIVSGGSTTISYYIQDTGNTCDAADGSKATVNISVPADVTASKSSLDFTTCGDTNKQGVDFSSSKVGDYEITVSVTDTSGSYNPTPAKFTLHVTNPPPPSNTAPTLTLPGDQTAEATGPGGATVTYTATAADAEDNPDPTPVCSPASGYTFPVGSTQVNCSVTDSGGLTTSGFFAVTVEDTTAPSLTLPDNQTAEATGPGGAMVTFDDPTANDIVDGAITPSCDAASGDQFPVGTTTVTCTATDAHGNIANGSFTVTVTDTTPPTLTLPDNQTAEATGPGGAAVSFTASANDIVDGNVPVNCDADSGDTFPLGETTVNCSAADAAGNTANGSFTVTVRDTTGPALSLPANITTTATSNSQATVNFTATANDLVDGSRQVDCTPPSGTNFSAGTTTVNCSSSDSRGNTSNGSFTVTVNYNWTGFFQPVDNPGTFNKVKIGSTVPVKFSLGGNQGLNIFFSSAYPQVSKPITCGVNPAVDTLEEYAPTGTNSGLKYDATANQYIYNWKTDGYKAGECRSLIVKLADGSVKTANFTFFK